ncbi:MAG: hypothetical protein U1D25_00670 [Hydrogenophaga sp.]|uniref:hypothetical protein n=1 Tax=Hydrogenophaga sp. TaxID=1904254 RepID=UPI00274ED5AB|nr:hypothetical protein [Hydrogenophaga sp.]MDP2416196.1 hypothetical protein [Hydrogenophaga sp.]MDZ4186608.1 hypothetical protein [Hydrogenophaga sp.]
MTERKFSKEVGEWIALQFIQDWATSETDGIRVKKSMEANDCTQVLSWTPACEMDGWPNSPDALTYPSLPYPFTAKELAAFLLAGTGSMVAEYYGDFSDGPDEDRLQALGIKAGHAKEALRQAYTEIRRAIAEVGEVDQELQQKAHTLRHQFHDANLEANNKENIWESGISDDQYRVRRERARQSVKQLEEETDSVGRSADADLKRWNAAMVKALLYPAPVVTDAALPDDVPGIAQPAPAAPFEAVADSTIVEDLQPEPPPDIAPQHLVPEGFAPTKVSPQAQQSSQAAPAPELTPAPHLSGALPEAVTTNTDAQSPRPVQRQHAQEQKIIHLICEAGFDPKNLPKNKPGKPGVKATVRKAAARDKIFTGTTVFDKTWERLRNEKQIADSP